MTASNERLKVLEEFTAEILKRQLSNAENLDKAMLSLASAGLGLSVAFLKDLSTYAPADRLWLLYASWGLFFLTIVSTLLSYGSSQLGLSRQLLYARKVLRDNDETYRNKRNVFATATNVLTYGAGCVFLLAITSTVGFLFSLDVKGVSPMTRDQVTVPVAPPVIEPPPLKLPKDPPLKLPKKGAPIPAIPDPAPATPVTEPAPPPKSDPKPEAPKPGSKSSSGGPRDRETDK